MGTKREWFSVDSNWQLGVQLADQYSAPTWPDPQVPQQIHLDLYVESVEALDLAERTIVELGGKIPSPRPRSGSAYGVPGVCLASRAPVLCLLATAVVAPCHGLPVSGGAVEPLGVRPQSALGRSRVATRVLPPAPKRSHKPARGPTARGHVPIQDEESHPPRTRSTRCRSHAARRVSRPLTTFLTTTRRDASVASRFVEFLQAEGDRVRSVGAASEMVPGGVAERAGDGDCEQVA